MRRFLPILSPAPNAQTERFSDENARFLGDLGSAMPVVASRTEGRVPSPISRAYVFYANLHARGLDHAPQATPGAPGGPPPLGGPGAPGMAGAQAAPGRRDLQEEARATFRGLVTLFALRRVLGFDIVLEGQHIATTPQGQPGGSLSDVLLTALRAAPGGERFWNPVRYFKLVQGSTKTLFAGLSPLTGFFPAGRAPEHLPGVYWYEFDAQAKTGRWYDPTSGRVSSDPNVRIDPRTTETVRTLMAAWLRYGAQHFYSGFLDAIGVERGDQDLLLGELGRWNDELRTVQVPEGVAVQAARMRGVTGEGDLPTMTNGQPLALFEAVVEAPGAFLLSDFPLKDGRLVVSLNELALGHVRVYGRRFGSIEVGEAGKLLPERGDDLGVALRWGPHVAPVPFVVIDRLFTPRLTLLTARGLSPEWDGMDVDMGGGRTEKALYPFKPTALDVFTPEELRRATASLSQDGRLFTVVLPLAGERRVSRAYHNGEGEYRLDDRVSADTLDLRLFPNFDLEPVKEYLPVYNGTRPDAVYYARVRLHPTWGFATTPINAAGQAIGQQHILGSTEMPLPHLGNRSAGQAAFFEMDEKPSGFSLQDRGLVFVRLASQVRAGVSPANWVVGVDFGTSNTCVSYKVLDGTDAAQPDVLKFQAMTTTLLATPSYVDDLDQRVMEGAAAMLDFFPPPEASLKGSDVPPLNRHGYFPSQVITQQSTVDPTSGFGMAKGLLYARNLSLVDPRQIDLIDGMPELGSYAAQRTLERRFFLRRNIKWREKDWLLVFLQHLRKVIVLTAALHRARVTEVRFSYPKSFNHDTLSRFRRDFKLAWADAGGAGAGALEGAGTPQQVTVRDMSESEATKGRLVKANMPVVVIDIGGGTTDVTGFKAGAAIFQTSFLLSAGHLNRYVTASRPLREAIQEHGLQMVASSREGATNSFTLIEKHFTGEGSAAASQGSLEMMWFAMLQALEDRGKGLEELVVDLRIDEGSPERRRAVEGFFLSATLLFSGLAYFSGYVTRKVAEASLGGADALRGEPLRIEMTGNGSKLYRLLSGGGVEFHPVFVDLFLAGMRQADADLALPNVSFGGLYKHNSEEAPKVTVALGLLETTEEQSHIPLYAGLGEEMGEDQPATARAYYERIEANRAGFRFSDEPPTLLRRFLDALDDRMPHGLNGGARIIPLARGSETWAEDLLDQLYAQKARGHVQERVVETSKMVKDLGGVEAGKEPALEPLFIAELAGLLDAIREVYAGAAEPATA